MPLYLRRMKIQTTYDVWVEAPDIQQSANEGDKLTPVEICSGQYIDTLTITGPVMGLKQEGIPDVKAPGSSEHPQTSSSTAATGRATMAVTEEVARPTGL